VTVPELSVRRKDPLSWLKHRQQEA
jgi:hypothetical protein